MATRRSALGTQSSGPAFSAYSARRWKQLNHPTIRKVRPYLMFDAVMDSPRDTAHLREARRDRSPGRVGEARACASASFRVPLRSSVSPEGLRAETKRFRRILQFSLTLDLDSHAVSGSHERKSAPQRSRRRLKTIEAQASATPPPPVKNERQQSGHQQKKMEPVLVDPGTESRPGEKVLGSTGDKPFKETTQKAQTVTLAFVGNPCQQ